MTAKFGVGIVFMKARVSAKFHCPTSTVTLMVSHDLPSSTVTNQIAFDQ